MTLELLERAGAEADANFVILKEQLPTLEKMNANRMSQTPIQQQMLFASAKLPDLKHYVSHTCKPAISSFIARIEKKEELSEGETGILRKMLGHQYFLATLPIICKSANADVFHELQADVSHGSLCLYEEFNKTASLIHNLFTANMIREMKGVLNYLITSPNNLGGHASYNYQQMLLNINPDCYGLFGPALKPEEEIRAMWDDELQKWKATSYIPFSQKTLGHTYHIGHGAAISNSIKHAKFFNLEEVLAYRKSIHLFFGDLMKLCNIEATAFDTLVLPVLNLLVRGEAEITVEFVNTLMEFVPQDELEAAMKVAGKFVTTPEPQKAAAAAAAAAAPGDDDEELAAALPELHHTTGIRPAALLNACGVANADATVLDKMSNGNFASIAKHFKDAATGNTLLHLAALGGNAQSIHTLVKHGADMDATNNDGQKPMALVPAGNDDVLQAFRDATHGRMTPISGEVVETMSKLAANLGEDPDFEAFFENIKTLHKFADAKYTCRAAQDKIAEALKSADPNAMMEFFANLEHNTSMPALDAPYKVVEAGADAADFDLFG